MNKYELIQKLSGRLSVSCKESKHYVDALLDIVAEDLSEGNNLMLQGFGTFSRWQQVGRVGRNPRTGKACMIQARNSVKFKPGKFLLERMNKGKDKTKKPE